jgi:hypothetical protein
MASIRLRLARVMDEFAFRLGRAVGEAEWVVARLGRLRRH